MYGAYILSSALQSLKNTSLPEGAGRYAGGRGTGNDSDGCADYGGDATLPLAIHGGLANTPGPGLLGLPDWALGERRRLGGGALHLPGRGPCRLLGRLLRLANLPDRGAGSSLRPTSHGGEPS